MFHLHPTARFRYIDLGAANHATDERFITADHILTSTGTVVGVATAQARGGQALNFAIPIDFARVLISRTEPLLIVKPLAGRPVEDDAENFGKTEEAQEVYQALAMSDWIRMLRASRALAAKFPKDATAHYAVGHACLRLGLHDEAVVAFRESVALNDDMALSWAEMGEAYDKKSDFDQACVSLAKAVSIRPDLSDAWAWLARARAQRTLGEGIKSPHIKGVLAGLVEAERAADTAVQLDPRSSAAWEARGFVHRVYATNFDVIGKDSERTNRLREAEKSYRRAVDLSPQNGAALFGLAEVQVQLGNRAGAEDTIAMLKIVDPKAAELARSLLPDQRHQQ